MADPAGERRFRSLDLFDCSSSGVCRRFGTRELDPEARAARCCARPDFDTATWTAEHVERVYLGADPDYEAEAHDPNWERPFEDIESNGCPGSWSRSAFVQSLMKYRRPQDASGNRVGHHAYDGVSDLFVREALRVWEGEEMAAESYRLQVMTG